MEDITNLHIQSRSESRSTSSYYSCLSSPTKCDGDLSASDHTLEDLGYDKKSSFTPKLLQFDAFFSSESKFMHTHSQLNLPVSSSTFDTSFSSCPQTSNDARSHSPTYTSQAPDYETLPNSPPITNGTSDHYRCEDDFTRYLDNMLLSIASDPNYRTIPSINSLHTTPQSNDTDRYWFDEVSPILCDEGKDVDNEDPGRVHAQSDSSPLTLLPGLYLPLSFYCESASGFESGPDSASEHSSSGYTGTILSPCPSASLAQELMFGGERYYDNSSDGSSRNSDRSSFFARSISGRSPLNLKRTFPEDLRPRSGNSDKNRESPLIKKRKTEAGPISTLTASKSLTSVEFPAAEPASLRKSSSLQSQNVLFERRDTKNPKIKLSLIPCRTTSDTDTEEDISPPTVPVTPATHPGSLRRGHPPRYSGPRTHQNAISSPVPIIAPPTYAEIPKTPLSADDAAEIRLKLLLEKERGTRLDDGLAAYIDSAWPSKNPVTRGGGQDQYVVDQQLRHQETDGFRLSPGRSRTLGIDDCFRKEIIHWILQSPPIQPTRLSYDHSYVFSADLHDQLSTSPETRFHAAYLFIRYLLRAVGDDYEEIESLVANSSLHRFNSLPNGDDQVHPCHLEHATKTIIWDIAVGCLALSVKLHRDFLQPLNPVYAIDFLAISPQDIAYDDLETSQRDILKAFGYSLGQNTPQPFMDELWSTLPSLRALLNFKGGWEATQREAWEVLSDAICEPDILRFPISLLTASALISGLVSSLVDYYRHEDGLQLKKRPWDDPNSGVISETENEISLEMYIRRATRATKYVVADFRDVLGISHEYLKECRRWLAEL